MFGEKSRFACLKIDDDVSSSDDERKNKKVATGKDKVRNAAKGDGKKNTGGLIVHNIASKPKVKGKKSKKMPTVETDGFLVQSSGDDYVERKYHEDLRMALKLSLESSIPPPSPDSPTVEVQPFKDEGTKDPVEKMVQDIDAFAFPLYSVVGEAQFNREKALVELYRSKLLETLKQLAVQKEAFSKVEEDAGKYRQRYRKMCELLKDAEVNEKAHLLVELEKARKTETEMGEQIAVLQGELEQARTKIREYEKKQQETNHKR